MVLSVDRETHKVFAALQNDGNAERYECNIFVCPDPVCTCRVVTVALVPERTNSRDSNRPHPRRVVIDLVGKRLSFNEEEKIPKDDLAFAGLFLSQLDEGDFEFLWKRYFSVKNELSENADPRSINAHFEYHEIETEGLLVAYNDVLPFGDQMGVIIGGKQYIIDDQFCLVPHCSCKEITLSFAAPDDDGKRAKEACAIILDYNKRQWGKVFAYSISFSADTIGSAIEAQIPDIYKKLSARHMRLKAIYAHCKKRYYVPKQPLEIPKVGRNDPCPCGSGKKYKKCCLMKIN